MLDDMTIDKLVGQVTVAQSFPNECGIHEGDDNEGRIVGRRKAQQFVFEHLANGCISTIKKAQVDGRNVTTILLWSLKPKGE